ncbi:DC-STAMP domain-containing protein 2 isoform X2 [Dunckerocampus dactyliophorus]|uniref:DC-STAMP domain-containing protein 2 isoform X2 n=1 Tax=Dunckerocampus dactyliophorus TaxID=161453 RepID=UPI002405C857|nr:DC-STAMP domain-containing protein 2 isoform X2 [Dunckerocampus dactyliophorus]
MLGLLLASAYGAMVIILQKQSLWVCVYSTVGVATVAAFGMGLSADMRVNIMVMLPSLCSAHGRNFLLFLCTSLLLSGPLTNMMENTERAAASLVCGGELAANQTREWMQKAATPLLSALDQIREISRNAVATVTRVEKLIQSLTDAIRHVARTLRNVLHFLVDIGDVCNAKLGSPHRKCQTVFRQAKSDCSAQLGDFNFLCDIVSGLQPLCKVANAATLFCTIPSYIATQLKERLVEPTISAFQRMRRQFDFNLTVTAILEADVNVSRSLGKTGQSILEELTADLRVFKKLSGLLSWASPVLLACSLLRAVQYRRRYLTQMNFDNVYISAQFIELDSQVTAGGGASILPITRRESTIYITPLSPQLTSREWQAVLVSVAWVLRHTLWAGLLVALDFLVFWLLDQVHRHVQGDVVGRAPVTVAVQVKGLGYTADIMRDVVASFNVLQGGNITMISSKCVLVPSEPDYAASFAIGFLLGMALLMALVGGPVQRARRLICAHFHPETELERISFLRQLILDERRAVGRALVRAGSRGQAHGAQRGGHLGRHLGALLLRLPRGGAYLSDLLAASSDMCLACGRRAGFASFICDVPECPGLYCQPCFSSLGNVCDACARPLTFQEYSEEEIDSSDDERQDVKGRSFMVTDCELSKSHASNDGGVSLHSTASLEQVTVHLT